MIASCADIHEIWISFLCRTRRNIKSVLCHRI